ncbi:MAG TPA: YetF domain-containing protein [Pyrinomonadaceae bacterium]|nr:YetF domain-containing protein [Pyrinomonadaceae bacterium]
MFFDSWAALWQVFLTGLLSYFILIFFLLISGKRTLSKWNAFDFVVTIAFGSLLASVMLSKDVTLAEGALGLGLLVGLQFVITWLSVRSKAFRRLIKAEPTLLLRNGEFIEESLKQQRITESEILAAIRENGQAAREDIAAIVLETDGSFSVIAKIEGSTYSAMSDVAHFHDDDKSETPNNSQN